jgi:UDP-glucuronate 4-epimerase
VNVQGTLNLLDAARHSGTPRFVLASTGSTYGQDTPVPFKESAPADHPLAPYPASKRAMEMFAHGYHHLWKLPTTILRFFNVYGPHGRPDMMPWMWSRAISRGEPITLYAGGKLKRDWTYIDDIVAGFTAALDRGLDYEVINLGGSHPVENLEFIRILEELLGRKANIVDTPTPLSELMISYADITKARKLLGYDPKVDVREGLKRFVGWMRAEGLL